MSYDNVSPVTEAEVMDFMRRVATTVVSYSKQQGDIDNLNQRLSDTSTERDHLRSENSRLNSEVGQITEIATSYETERNEAVRQIVELQGKLRYQEEMAIARDAKVAEVQGHLKTMQEDRDNYARSSDHYKDQLGRVEAKLDEVSNRAAEDRKRLAEAEAKANEATTKLDKIPLPIRAHFTGESLEPPKPEPVQIAEYKPEPWNPPVEMKPVVEEDKPEEQHPTWLHQ